MTASTLPAGTKPGNRKPRSLTLTEAGTNAIRDDAPARLRAMGYHPADVVWVPVLRVRWRKDVAR